MVDIVYNVELVMVPEFLNWHYNAKNRISDYKSTHATDFTDGNIDYTLHIYSFKGRTLYGDLTLHVPAKYRTAGGRTIDYLSYGSSWLKEAAIDALISELNNGFGKKYVQSWKVTRSINKRRLK